MKKMIKQNLYYVVIFVHIRNHKLDLKINNSCTMNKHTSGSGWRRQKLLKMNPWSIVFNAAFV